MTATGSPRLEGGNWTTEVVYCDEPSDPANPGPLPISTRPKYATMQTWLMRIGTDIDNVEMVTTDNGGRIPPRYQEFVEVFSKKMAETLPPHRQLTMLSILNPTRNYHAGGSTTSQSSNRRRLWPTSKRTCQTASFNCHHPRPLRKSFLQRKETED